ncbi:hypothetical protein [Planctopirus hydrillae]|uniref:hypothetical protein n=1 Tax=Planctopirus hydrillae TaxID=1841610 RepID=UPI0010426F30|nr:hypothetical protein [Planctopirus hydrillae]
MCDTLTLNSRSFDGSLTISLNLVNGGDAQLSVVFATGHSKGFTSIGYCTLQQLRIWVDDLECVLRAELPQAILCDYEDVFTFSLHRSPDDTFFINADARISSDSLGGSFCCCVTQMRTETEELQIMRDCFKHWIYMHR